MIHMVNTFCKNNSTYGVSGWDPGSKICTYTVMYVCMIVPVLEN